MTTAILWRLAWKEYRALRTFWLAMAGLAVLLQLLFVASPSGPETIPWIFACALAAPALYALACGATMFAAEHDDGTFEFLRGLPLVARQVLIGKLMFAVASTLLLLALLWCLANWLTRWWPLDGQTHLNLWGLWGMAAFESLAWGMFFSLLLKRPLQAAILGVTATSVAIHLVVWTIAPPGHQWNDLGPYLTAVPYRAAIAAIVLLVDMRLACRWLHAPGVGPRPLFQSRSLFALKRRTSAVAGVATVPRPDYSAVIARLAWQTWRQSAWLILTLVMVGAAASLLFPYESVFGSARAEGPRIAVIAIVASLMGSCVFLADQEGRSYRFFAEHGVRPRSVWFVRQLIWIATLMIWAVAVHALWFTLEEAPSLGRAFRNLNWEDVESQRYFGARFMNFPPFILSICLSLLAFTAGQLASMLLRSGILAGFIGLVLTAAVCGWALVMHLLEINWLWSVVPLGLALFAATWLRTPDWILERNHWRAWLRIAFVLAAPTITLLVAVPLYRVHEIPLASPGFSPEEFARPITPDQEKTADMYRRAGERLVFATRKSENKLQRPPDAEEMEFLHENEESLALVLAASKRPDCSFYDLQRGDASHPPNSHLLFLLDASARERESAGQLDQAWDRYLAALRFTQHARTNAIAGAWMNADLHEIQVHRTLAQWAARPGQSAERIVAAIKNLDELDRHRPAVTDAIKANHVWRMRQLMAGDLAQLVESSGVGRLSMKHAVLAHMPRERTRALRLLNLGTANDLQFLDFIDDLRREGRPLAEIILFQREYFVIDGVDRSRAARSWSRTTFLLNEFHWLFGLDVAQYYVRVETHRRAARLLLALEAWKAVHGALPESLTQLVGQYLDEIPLDPYSGRPFLYFREGQSPPQSWDRKFAADSGLGALPRTAFLWSAGERVQFPDWALNPIPPDDNDADPAESKVLPDFYGVTLYESRTNRRTPTSEYELLLAGEWFEIP